MLSLKEGFTVFRDQQFSADMGSAAVKRIEDVRVLRAAQFPEDSGPLAYPVRPESYMEISNRSEEHTSELQSLMSNSYAVICLKQKTKKTDTSQTTTAYDK